VEARATIKETSVSRVFVGAILVLVAMGLGAMGGYVVKGAGAGTNGAQTQVVRPAPGTVLRQDNDYPKYGVQQSDTSAIQALKGGTRGDHGDLP
jgi:hypothetical protein